METDPFDFAQDRFTQINADLAGFVYLPVAFFGASTTKLQPVSAGAFFNTPYFEASGYILLVYGWRIVGFFGFWWERRYCGCC